MVVLPLLTGMLLLLAAVTMEPMTTLLLATLMLAGVAGVKPLLVMAVTTSVPVLLPAV